ncbi:trehalase [Chlamydoabsidia padenii]|nr:trehalase [Chlamydoabsidia padenii]
MINQLIFFVSIGIIFLVQVSAESLYCDSPIYCESPVLKTIQLAKLFNDSKTFVDMPTTKPVDQILQAFDALGPNPNQSSLLDFVHDHFAEAGSEMQPYPVTIHSLDWLEKIKDIKYKGWIDILHHAWADLTFKFNTTMLCEGCVSSTLPVQRPFVVPGGRFREFYYWDSYFVIEGLLQSGLHSLALDMIENFFDFVDRYGFMPNGARIYYLNRSQPPFLAEMVHLYYEKTKDIKFLQKALPILDKEYMFWQKNTSVTIRQGNKSYKLNRYNVINHSPRPESYLEDYNTVYNVSLDKQQQDDLFSDLATGAETGWDYSSRWTKIKELGDNITSNDILRSLDTRHVIPVDLNSLLWSMENHLANWHAKLDRRGRGRRLGAFYEKQAQQRLEAMDTLLWNPTQASFYDYNLTSHAQSRNEYTSASLFPFWLGAVPARAHQQLDRVFDATRQVLQKYPGILTSTDRNTTMQWDLPNGWPPLQYVAIQAMRNVDQWLNKAKYGDLAKVLAERMAASAFCSWYLTGGSIPGALAKANSTMADNGHMFEKFDVRSLSASGFGGEYTVQVGFGWTNGVVMWIMNQYNDLVAPDCSSNNIYPIT